MRYRLNINGEKIVYPTDVELNRVFQSDVGGAEGDILVQDYLDFIHDADLLIADGQYTEEEYSIKVGWGHSSIPVLIDLADRAQVKQLAIFHHDPQHSEKILDKLWMEIRSRYPSSDKKMHVFWAREGLTLVI